MSRSRSYELLCKKQQDEIRELKKENHKLRCNYGALFDASQGVVLNNDKLDFEYLSKVFNILKDGRDFTMLQVYAISPV